MNRTYKYLTPAAVKKLANINLVARQVVEGFISGLHKSPYHGFSVEFAEYREYSPGDDLKHFDWKVLARCDKGYVKQYEEETNLKAYILLDISNSMVYKSKELTKLEYASYLAASLAYLMIRQKDSVGLVLFDEKIEKYLPPRCSSAHLKELLISLENITLGRDTDVAKTLHDMAESIKRRGLIILISDLYDEADRILKGLSHFRHKKHEVIVFHVLDDAELEFPFRGLSDFRDLETGEKIQVHPDVVRRHYLKEMKGFITDFKRECSVNFIDYVVANTKVPFDYFLMLYLSKRARMH